MKRADTGTLLRRALERSADAAGVALTIESQCSQSWASTTFTGARHELSMSITGADAAAWLGGLPETEFGLRGHLVADLQVVRIASGPDETLAVIEALTVEDC